MAGRGLGITVERLEELGADLRDFERRLPLAIQKALENGGGEALESSMERLAPRRTGGLVAGIGIHSVGGVAMIGYLGALSGGAVKNGRNQLGRWIESGTKPHVQRAGARNNAAQAMYFGGKYVEEIHHPGSRARKVAQRSIRSAKWEVEAAVVDELDKIAPGVWSRK